MAVPARPASGAPIDSVWGGIAHDAAVAQDVQSGSDSITMTAAVSGQITKTFPRPFAAPPIVVATQASGTNGTFAAVGAITATTVVLQIQSRSGAAITATHGVTWIAVGPRA
jgi:hypothetical protein